MSRAARVIQFIEALTIPSGEGAGGRFKLREWQKEFIRAVYDPVYPTGRRVVRRAVLSIARKNGKTALAAALVLVHLLGPESIRNAEIYSAANDRAQAAQVFKYCTQLINADPELQSLLEIVESQKRIINRSLGSFYCAISAEAGTKHGFNPTMVIFDELAQARTSELYDVLDTSMGARAEPLFLTISTQSNDPQHILSKLIDDGLSGQDPTTVCRLYAAPEGAELDDPKAWAAANPALGDFLPEKEIEVAAARAKRIPSFEPTVRNLHLNQRVSPHASLIARADWMGCLDSDLEFKPGEPIYLAYDGAIRTDLAALVAISINDGSRAKAWFFKPAELVAEHARRDGVPYQAWAQDGWLITTPGRSIDPMAVALKVAELTSEFEVRGLAYDRWKIDEFLRCLDGVGLLAQVDDGPGLRLVPWGQGFRDMAPAIDAFEAAVLQGELRHDGNPVLTWNVANAMAITDPAGSRKIDKSKSRFRVDGSVALAMALGLKARDRAAPTRRSPWEDENFSMLNQFRAS